MSKVDQFSIRCTLDGGNDLGEWATSAGGSKDSTELKFKPGGMTPEISLGGSIQMQNITLTRLYDEATALATPVYRGRVGKGRCVVSQQLLDRDGNPSPIVPPTVWTGILKAVNPPDADSMGNSAALLTIEVSTDGDVHA